MLTLKRTVAIRSLGPATVTVSVVVFDNMVFLVHTENSRRTHLLIGGNVIDVLIRCIEAIQALIMAAVTVPSYRIQAGDQTKNSDPTLSK